MTPKGDACQQPDCDGTIEIPKEQQHPAGPDIASFDVDIQIGICIACGAEYQRPVGIPPGPWGPKL